MRVARTAKATLTKAFSLDEVVTPSSGLPSVSVYRLDGTLAFGPSDAAGPDADGAYSYVFPGSDLVDEFVVEWSLTVGGDALVMQDHLEVAGAFYFSLAEGRDVDTALASTSKYPTADLIDRRVEAEDECERITGQAWVPRFRRAVLSGRGYPTLVLPDTMIRAIRSVTVGGLAFTPQQTAALEFTDAGALKLTRGWTHGGRNVVVEYEHGHDRPNTEIVRAAKIRFKSMLLEGRSAMPDRAERTVTVDQSGGSVTYGSPSVGRTGIPLVDAIYGAHPSPRPGFG